MEKIGEGGMKILNSCSDLRPISAVLLTSATNVATTCLSTQRSVTAVEFV